MNELRYKEISKILPHRFPFLLIDKVIEASPDHAIGIKNVSMTDPFLVGHFPDEPIYPGVLLIESCSQLGGIMVSENKEYSGSKAYIAQVNDFKFISFIQPGDSIYIYSKPINKFEKFVKVGLEAKVDEKIVAKGTVTYIFNKS